MVIMQGDICWVDFGEPTGSEVGGNRPAVVIQNGEINQSLIRTVLVCPLTTNLRRATAKGNVLLDEDEAGLEQRSVVNVSQTIGIDKTELGEYVGTLLKSRVREIVMGINIIITPSDMSSEVI